MHHALQLLKELLRKNNNSFFHRCWLAHVNTMNIFQAINSKCSELNQFQDSETLDGLAVESKQMLDFRV